MSTLTTRATGVPGEIFIIADCEGAIDRVRLALREAGLTDAAGQWCAPAGTTLVQLGDATDRGPRSIALQLYLAALAEQAEAAGSRVELVAGNHEAMAALASVDPEAGRMWGANGMRAVVDEALERGLLAPGSEVHELLTSCGGAWTIGDWRHDAGFDAFVASFSEMLYGSETAPGLLERYVRRLRPFVRIGDAFFAHGGMSRWVAEGARVFGGLEAFADRVGAEIRDPALRGGRLAQRFFSDVGIARGGVCQPYETSPCWLDVTEWPAAMRDETTMGFLREEGIVLGFFGHTPSVRPFTLRVNSAGEVGRVVLPGGSPVKDALVSGVVFSAFELDCGLQRDKKARPHIYRWDGRTRTLEAFAFAQKLQAA